METNSIEVIKGHQALLNFEVERAAQGNGVIFTFRIHPKIEELIKTMGNGGYRPLTDYGTRWMVYPPDSGALSVWNLLAIPRELNPYCQPATQLATETYFKLDLPGRDMWAGNNMINLSWLRIVGASEREHTRLLIDNGAGLHSRERVIEYANKVQEAVKILYRSTMKPFNVRLNMTISDL